MAHDLPTTVASHLYEYRRHFLTRPSFCSIMLKSSLEFTTNILSENYCRQLALRLLYGTNIHQLTDISSTNPVVGPRRESPGRLRESVTSPRTTARTSCLPIARAQCRQDPRLLHILRLVPWYARSRLYARPACRGPMRELSAFWGGVWARWLVGIESGSRELSRAAD